MKYFLSAGIYHIDAVVIVLGCWPYLDVCDWGKKTFFIFCGGPHSKSFMEGHKNAVHRLGQCVHG